MSARALRWSGLLALGLVLTGCPGDDPEPVGDPVRFEVGTGVQFTALEEGAPLELFQGGQGSQHVFVSMRAWDLTEMEARVELALERTSDGERVSSRYKVDLRFEPGRAEGEPALLEGLLLVVPDVAQAVGREVRLKASFTSDLGQHGSDSHTGTLDWAANPFP
ncbi:hypothetical protein [Pyxidicoccus xibeiensis]|uniref:hypothetical protein n=1 Tax=Pyxidicoccus xibeiensis TaxID=2906759 RepID=UPI0020A7016C|nr:hypothetical protein [Pyxidicoccus xibeiensis]MCP3137004.1 hypothetical protein [Pyxidicoccus xibeiensis]